METFTETNNRKSEESLCVMIGEKTKKPKLSWEWHYSIFKRKTNRRKDTQRKGIKIEKIKT